MRRSGREKVEVRGRILHIEKIEVFLIICPNIHKKVNIRTILQSMMERLTNYYANASLLEGEEIYGVNGDISNVSFQIFDN